MGLCNNRRFDFLPRAFVPLFPGKIKPPHNLIGAKVAQHHLLKAPVLGAFALDNNDVALSELSGLKMSCGHWIFFQSKEAVGCSPPAARIANAADLVNDLAIAIYLKAIRRFVRFETVRKVIGVETGEYRFSRLKSQSAFVRDYWYLKKFSH
jgi:hypothetical protein